MSKAEVGDYAGRWKAENGKRAKLRHLTLSLSLSQHDGVPYCHIPCYGYLFGPKGGQPHPRHWA